MWYDLNSYFFLMICPKNSKNSRLKELKSGRAGGGGRGGGRENITK
jgi:hypothetical protein